MNEKREDLTGRGDEKGQTWAKKGWIADGLEYVADNRGAQENQTAHVGE